MYRYLPVPHNHCPIYFLSDEEMEDPSNLKLVLALRDQATWNLAVLFFPSILNWISFPLSKVQQVIEDYAEVRGRYRDTFLVLYDTVTTVPELYEMVLENSPAVALKHLARIPPVEMIEWPLFRSQGSRAKSFKLVAQLLKNAQGQVSKIKATAVSV